MTNLVSNGGRSDYWGIIYVTTTSKMRAACQNLHWLEMLVDFFWEIPFPLTTFLSFANKLVSHTPASLETFPNGLGNDYDGHSSPTKSWKQNIQCPKSKHKAYKQSTANFISEAATCALTTFSVIFSKMGQLIMKRFSYLFLGKQEQIDHLDTYQTLSRILAVMSFCFGSFNMLEIHTTDQYTLIKYKLIFRVVQHAFVMFNMFKYV